MLGRLTFSLYIQWVSNEMQEYHNIDNNNHDLVVSDLTRKRFCQVTMQESLFKWFIVAIMDAFNMV